MIPKEILQHVRTVIEEHSEGDADRWWYANRFVFARLQLDERRTKTAVRKSLLESSPRCHLCGQPFETKKGIHLHRLDASKGYNHRNSALIHAECHRQHHAEAFECDNEPDQEISVPDKSILVKKSKFYGDMAFVYWWDVAPPLAGKLDKYREVRFLCKDTGLWCSVDAQQLKSFLAEERRTSRGSGHWGIKVLAGREEELAFEPGSGEQGGEWLYLPVTWEDSE